MCGIMGYVGNHPAQDVILDGLERLEYRGYDSAGIALLDEGAIRCERAVGNLAALRDACADLHSQAHTGIGHTRWATHGGVTLANAHPHRDASGRIAVVMNGIIENYRPLRETLAAHGVPLLSETDTEVIPHLIARAYHGNLLDAVRAIIPQLSGHYAFVVMHQDHPGLLVAARQECPLVIGVGAHEHFISSTLSAFLAATRDTMVIESGDVVAVTADTVTCWHGADAVTRPIVRADADADAGEKGGFETFMLKEIHEQPESLYETLAERLGREGSIDLAGIGLDDAALSRVERVHILACGTSYHAGKIGQYWLEDWAHVPVHVDIASEARYRTCLEGPGDLVIGITQSGETADTIAAMRRARERGAHVVALTNIMGSHAAREADGALYTRAGLEIGVAATKSHTAQLALLALLALRIGRLRHALSASGVADLADELRAVPSVVEQYLSSPHAQAAVEAGARQVDAPLFMFLGRHVSMPVALEGALKLKEISYVPADAYPAGEMKHGPIALIAPGVPVVALAPDGHVFDKMVSNIEEVRARGAYVIAIASEDNAYIEGHADEVLRVPHTIPLLSPFVSVIALQLFAYGLARARGLNVDQPRNLAKTVTVE